MSEPNKSGINVLESITPVELLMASDVKDVTEKEWEAALDACAEDLAALEGKLSEVPLVRNMQQTINTQNNRSRLPSGRVYRHVLADCYARVLRCYVARARKAAKPKVSSHTPPLSVDLPAVWPWALPPSDYSFERQFLQELDDYVAEAQSKAQKKDTAQQPVIPEHGLCWAKCTDGSWVIYRNRTVNPIVSSVPIRKSGKVWVAERHTQEHRTAHDTLHQAMCSLERTFGGPIPKPTDENQPWIILTADGKLELEKVPRKKATATLWINGVNVGHATEVSRNTRQPESAAPREEPLKPWKERPEDLYWFRVDNSFALRDRKDPDWFKFPRKNTNELRADLEKTHGLPRLPVIRTSGYWLLGADDKYRVTVDGKEYVADGPNHAKRIQSEHGWPRLLLREQPASYTVKSIAEDDAKDAEGWAWSRVWFTQVSLFHGKEFKGEVFPGVLEWRGRIGWISLFGETCEEAMLTIEKFYNLPRLNRP